jgi:hypothetical protein
MNPKNIIENFEEVLEEVERLKKFDCLRELENRIINEIVLLINEGSESAVAKIVRLEKLVNQKLKNKAHNKFLISAFMYSISGALSAAKSSCL